MTSRWPLGVQSRLSPQVQEDEQRFQDHLHEPRLIETLSAHRQTQQTNTRQQESERELRGEARVKNVEEKQRQRAKHGKVEQLKPQTGSFSPTVRMSKHNG